MSLSYVNPIWDFLLLGSILNKVVNVDDVVVHTAVSNKQRHYS